MIVLPPFLDCLLRITILEINKNLIFISLTGEVKRFMWVTEIHILHAFREKMLVSNYSYIQVMACDTKMSYWLLRGFCFFLSLDRSCLVFPPFKTVSPYRTFNFTFSKKM